MWGTLLFLLFSLVFFMQAIQEKRRCQRLLQNGIPGKAIFQKEKRGKGFTDLPTASLTFPTPAGSSTQKAPRFLSQNPLIQTGAEVDIYYDPSDPTNFAVKENSSPKGRFLSLFILSGVSLLCALLWWLLYR